MSERPGHEKGRTAQVLPGSLLVSSPEMLDPNFSDTVVLMLDADDNGAVGVVLNRPSPVRVADVLEDWRDAVGEPEVLFHGGPVGPDGALAVGLLADPRDVPVGFRGIFGAVGVVDLDTPAELMEGSLVGLRIFAGYAGWGAGQLEGEIARGDWYVVPSELVDIFRVDPTDLWRDVLRRQPGDLAWHSTRPVDPELN